MQEMICRVTINDRLDMSYYFVKTFLKQTKMVSVNSALLGKSHLSHCTLSAKESRAV